MRNPSITIIILMGGASMALASEDVIYKNDGSILRGALIEQDFANGHYKIQLLGGSVFSVNKNDIQKISKEPSLSSKVQQTNDSGISVNIENSPNINQEPVITQTAHLESSVTDTGSANKGDLKPRKKQYQQSLRVARIIKDIKDNHDNGYSFKGFSLAYQYNINKYAAAYWEHSRGTLESVIVNDREVGVEEHGYTGTEERYYSSQLTTQVSTNNYQGFKLYAGIGLFSEVYTGIQELASVSGRVSTLGIGFNNNQVLVHFRISKYSSDHYPNQFSSLSTSLQVGLEF